MTRLTAIIWALALWRSVDASFKDFLVEPESHNAVESYIDEVDSHGCGQDIPGDELVPYSELMQDGEVNTDLLLAALLQHAKQLGLDMSKLGNLQELPGHDIDNTDDCNGGGQLSYEEQPSWRDVFF